MWWSFCRVIKIYKNDWKQKNKTKSILAYLFLQNKVFIMLFVFSNIYENMTTSVSKIPNKWPYNPVLLTLYFASQLFCIRLSPSAGTFVRPIATITLRFPFFGGVFWTGEKHGSEKKVSLKHLLFLTLHFQCDNNMSTITDNVWTAWNRLSVECEMTIMVNK